MTEAIIIESNRLNATVDDYRSDRHAFAASNTQNSNNFNRWRSNYPSGLQIKTGDQLQVEAWMLNSIGSGEEVIEFSGTNSNDSNSNISKLKDNKFRVEYLYYIHDRKEFNIPLPSPGHRINKNPLTVDYGGYDDGSFYTNTIHNDLENTVFSGGSESQELTNKRLYILNQGYRGHFDSDNYNTNPPSFLSSNIDYEVPIGFQFPSAIANTLTAQFHEREGSAEYKGSIFVQPSFFTMALTREFLNAGGSLAKTDFAQTLISEPTDKSFCSVPTWTGQVLKLIVDGKFGGDGVCFNILARSIPPGGNDQNNLADSGISNDDQKETYYSFMLTADPQKYLGMCNFHGVKSLPNLKDGDLTANPDAWKTACVYSGGTGYIGKNIVLMTSNLNTVTLPNASVRFKESSNKGFVPANFRAKISSSQAAGGTGNLLLMNAGVGNVFPTNIFYNEETIKFIAPALRQLEKIKDGSTAPFSIDFSNQDYLDSFEFEMNIGELDDEETNPSLNDYVFLPNPLTFSLEQQPVAFGDARYKQYPQYLLKSPNQNSPSVRATGNNNAGKILMPCLLTQKKAYSVKMKSQFNPNMDYQDWIEKGGSAGDYDENYNINSKDVNNQDYSLINPSTNLHGDTSLSRQYAVAIIPIFLKVATNSPMFGVPLMGFILNETLGVGVGQKRIPEPTLNELFAPSRSLCDGNYSKMLTTQKVVTATSKFYPTITDHLPVANNQNTDVAQAFQNFAPDYSPYLTVGANDPSITFDNTQSKFAFQGLSTSIYSGNGLFQEWTQASAGGGVDATIKPNSQADAQVVTVNQRSSSFNRLVSNGTTIGTTPARSIKADPEKVPYNYAQCGISINKVFLFDFVDNPVNCDSRQQKLFSGSMLDKMGFNLEQLLPFHGEPNNEFNRGFHNSHLGLDGLSINKQDNMVKPFTTNSYVNASIDIALVKSTTGANMYNLGSCLDQESNTNATTDLCLAENLPRKLDYPYLVVYSNLVDNSKYYGGQSSYDKLPAMAYVPRNYQTGDFIYSSATAWTYTADRDYVLSELIVDIRLPDGSPAPLAPNNSVIFKILRQNNILERHQQIIQEIEQAEQPTKK